MAECAMHAALAIVFLAAAAVPQVGGAARAIDGDTLEVAGQHVRLYGIDAPEAGQLCDLQGKASVRFGGLRRV